MQMALWDSLYNIVLLAFWFKVWNSGRDESVFNPDLFYLNRFCDTVIGGLRPLLLGLSARGTALVVWAALLILRGLVVPNELAARSLRFGLIVGAVHLSSPLWYPVFAALSFAVFLFKLWAVAAFVALGGDSGFVRGEDTIFRLTRPFSEITVTLRPWALVVWGAILGLVLSSGAVSSSAGSALSTFLRSDSGASVLTALVAGTKLMLCSLTAWVEALGVLPRVMLWLILGSWLAALTSAPRLADLCQEWIGLLLGPFRLYRIRVGIFDLSSLVFLLVFPIVQALLLSVLAEAYGRLL